jgi:hypothetical protein
LPQQSATNGERATSSFVPWHRRVELKEVSREPELLLKVKAASHDNN